MNSSVSAVERAIERLRAQKVGGDLYAFDAGKASIAREPGWHLVTTMHLQLLGMSKDMEGVAAFNDIHDASIWVRAEWWSPQTQYAVKADADYLPCRTLDEARQKAGLRGAIVTIDLSTGQEVLIGDRDEKSFAAGEDVLIQAKVVRSGTAFDHVYVSVNTLQRDGVELALWRGSILRPGENHAVGDPASTGAVDRASGALRVYYNVAQRAHVVAHDIIEAARVYEAESCVTTSCTDWNAWDDDYDLGLTWSLKNGRADEPGRCRAFVTMTASEWVELIGKPALLYRETKP